MNTLYLDMDGVVADFDAAAERFIGRPRTTPDDRWRQEDWQRIRMYQHWFLDLPKTAQADQIVTTARKFRDQLGWQLLFLTAIPRGNDFPWAFYDKIKWASCFYPDIPVHFGPYSDDKAAHYSTGDILVDDRLTNCEQWRAAGGEAIRARDLDLAHRELEALFGTLAARSASAKKEIF
jgi:hypothetical protein